MMMMMMMFKMMVVMMFKMMMVMMVFKMMMKTSRVVGAHWHELAATGYIGLILLLITSFTGEHVHDDDDAYGENLYAGTDEYLMLLLVYFFTGHDDHDDDGD